MVLFVLLLLLLVLLVLFDECHYLAPGWLRFLFGDWRSWQLVAFQQTLRGGLFILGVVSFASSLQTAGLFGC